MVILRIPPLSRWQDLRRNLGRFPPLFLRCLRYFLRLLFLLLVMVKDGGAVLGATITTLAILGGGIVHFVEKLEEGGVGEGGGVVGYLEGFGVCMGIGN